MIIVGLTGVIGSGKSTVSHILSELGAYTIDADEISRTVLDKDTPAYFETVEQPTIVIQRSISCHHSGFSGSVDNHIFVVCVVSAVDYR